MIVDFERSNACVLRISSTQTLQKESSSETSNALWLWLRSTLEQQDLEQIKRKHLACVMHAPQGPLCETRTYLLKTLFDNWFGKESQESQRWNICGR